MSTKFEYVEFSLLYYLLSCSLGVLRRFMLFRRFGAFQIQLVVCFGLPEKQKRFGRAVGLTMFLACILELEFNHSVD